MWNLLNKKIEYYYLNKLYLIYFLYIIFILLLSIFFGNSLIIRLDNLTDENNNIILNNIPFGYGPLIENLVHGNGYYQEWLGTNSFLVRFPFLPLFLTFLLKINTNIYFILIIKNIIFFSFFFISVLIASKLKQRGYIFFFSVFILFFYNFYNLTTILNFVFADAFIGILIPSAYLIIISNINNKYILLSLLLFIIFFMKTTMFSVVLTISILFIFFEKNPNFFKRLLPLISVLLAILIWGSFGYLKTGVFSLGTKISSDNQLALSITLNKNFHKYYPLKSVDLIPKIKPEKKFNGEWEMYDYYKEINKNYIKNNKERIIKDYIIKIKFILFNVRKDSVFPNEKGQFENPILFSHLSNRIICIISLLISSFLIFKNIINLNTIKDEVYFIMIYGSSIFPHIIGWATSKHLVGIFIMSHIYIVLKLLKSYK